MVCSPQIVCKQNGVQITEDKHDSFSQKSEDSKTQSGVSKREPPPLTQSSIVLMMIMMMILMIVMVILLMLATATATAMMMMMMLVVMVMVMVMMMMVMVMMMTTTITMVMIMMMTIINDGHDRDDGDDDDDDDDDNNGHDADSDSDAGPDADLWYGRYRGERTQVSFVLLPLPFESDSRCSQPKITFEQLRDLNTRTCRILYSIQAPSPHRQPDSLLGLCAPHTTSSWFHFCLGYLYTYVAMGFRGNL